MILTTSSSNSKKNNKMKKIFILFALALMCADGMAQIAGVSCCDWMMLKRQRPGAITLSKEIGADGVELDMGPLSKNRLFTNRFRPVADSLTVGKMDYTDPKNNPPRLKTGETEAESFLKTLKETGVKVSSIAMSGFYAQNVIRRKFLPGVEMSDAERIENYKAIIQDLLNTMRIFGAKVAFLPLGGSEKGWQQPGSDDYKVLVERLKMWGDMAAEEGVVIGVRTAMDAYYDLQLLRDVDSKGIKIYYSFQDVCDRMELPRYEGKPKDYGTDVIINELRLLGADRIASIHASNTDGFRLREDPELDMPRLKVALEEIGYHGWLTIERSRSYKNTRDTRGNYGDNVAYLHEVFGTPAK